MSYLPYTDGSNGNGIGNIAELLVYLKKCPLAFYDCGFMASYKELFLKHQDALAQKAQSQPGIRNEVVPELQRALSSQHWYQ